MISRRLFDRGTPSCAALSLVTSLVPLCEVGVMAGALVAILELEDEPWSPQDEAMLCGWSN